MSKKFFESHFLLNSYSKFLLWTSYHACLVIKATLYNKLKIFCWSVSGSFWPTFLITTMYNNFFRLKSSTLWKHFSDSPISARSFILFWLVFTFLTHQSENGVVGNTHVIVLIQQQFQCSSVRVNERTLQTEGPSQRAKDDEPGTFLLIN